MDSHSTQGNTREKLLDEIHMLVKLIEDTGNVDHLDNDIVTLRRIYHDCLKWRLEQMDPNFPPP